MMPSTFGLRRSTISKVLRGMADQSKRGVRSLMLRAISTALSRRYGVAIAVGTCDVAMRYYTVAQEGIGAGGPAWAEPWITSYLMMGGRMRPSDLAGVIERQGTQQCGLSASDFLSAGRGPLESAAYDAASPSAV